ncbi:unnamed protein product [Mytilus edulis]|uniref:C-type lectin domain-containing protein n=1 Tax=Mytilus edulis TaxID=6550 RepID=A0A8S3V2U7_MYTED|nr:unnamed protein product [Mytilus edulis]
MNDSAKEGDMERLILNMKENAAFYYSHSVMRANKTENGSRRASSSADIIHRIGDNVDHLLSIHKFTSSHAKKTSSKDLEIAINILSKEYYWLGALDMKTEGQWVWENSGTPVTFTDWWPGEPNVDDAAIEDCLTLFSSLRFKWLDDDCQKLRRSICEIKLSN